jgi:2'-hydroxyisoflavone reductase
VLAPGDPTSPVQFIDARDAAAWLLRQAQAGTTGVFNLSGPAAALSMGGFLESARLALNPAAHLRWANEAFLLAAGVAPWTDLPLWLTGEDVGGNAVSLARALASGLVCRPLAETLHDTLAWLRSLPPPGAGVAGAPASAGITREREAELLAALAGRPAQT